MLGMKVDKSYSKTMISLMYKCADIDRKLEQQLTFDLTVLDFDQDFLRTKAVYSLLLAQEHNFELVTVRIVIDEVSQFHVDRVILRWHVDGNFRFQVDNVSFEGFKLHLRIFEVFKELEGGLISFIHLIFDLS